MHFITKPFGDRRIKLPATELEKWLQPHTKKPRSFDRRQTFQWAPWEVSLVGLRLHPPVLLICGLAT